MVKGVIDFCNSKIPFVIEDYELTLFSEEELVAQFSKEYNNKKNYMLTGQYYFMGNTSSSITLLVEQSMGNICCLKYFILHQLGSKQKPDAIRFESSTLDSIFQYKHKYIDLSREGINLSSELIDIYSVPININEVGYELCYSIGQDNRKGLIDNFRMTGKTFIDLKANDFEECFSLVTLIKRLCMFMTSNINIDLSRIDLTANGRPIAAFYCKYCSDKPSADYDMLFYEFPIMKYLPKILDNLSLELGNEVTRSIPLGHIENYDNFYTPQRFLALINSFEYLFEKLEPQKSKDIKFPLKMELELMFNYFFEILQHSKLTATELAIQIKQLRRDIVHGKAYYYDFTHHQDIKYNILMLADLVQRMSLKHMKFSDIEISDFRKSLVIF